MPQEKEKTLVLLKKILIGVILLGLALSVIRYGRNWRFADERRFAYTASEAGRLSGFADALCRFGRDAGFRNDYGLAERYYKDALAANVLHMESWLELAHLRAATGNRVAAARILNFTDRVSGNVVKWKWGQLVLAGQLEMEPLFVRNANAVLSHPPFRKDALQILDLHFGRNAGKVLDALSGENLNYYLSWLLKWHRTDDALRAWEAISTQNNADARLLEDLVNYLVWKKELAPATRIWKEYAGAGMTNPGFEKPMSGVVFDWRTEHLPSVEIRRVAADAVEGRYAAEVSFSGRENIHGQLLRQVVPVTPGKTYRLSWRWRSRQLTTDQRPFIEINGYQCDGVKIRGNMIPPDTDWRHETLTFAGRADCRAVVVRLQRKKSHRFDSHIDGKLWLDGFCLEEAETPNTIRNQEVN